MIVDNLKPLYNAVNFTTIVTDNLKRYFEAAVRVDELA